MSERAFALGGIMLGLKELYVIAIGGQEFEWQKPTTKDEGIAMGKFGIAMILMLVGISVLTRPDAPAAAAAPAAAEPTKEKKKTKKAD